LLNSPQFMLLSAADSFQNPTHEVHELWQTDFTYFRVVGWGWYFLSTILDDYSRYIISWRLTTTMAASVPVIHPIPTNLVSAIYDKVD